MAIVTAIIWGIILGVITSFGVIHIAIMTHDKLEDE